LLKLSGINSTAKRQIHKIISGEIGENGVDEDDKDNEEDEEDDEDEDDENDEEGGGGDNEDDAIIPISFFFRFGIYTLLYL